MEKEIILFPVDNVDAWFYGNLDNTMLPEWFIENHSTTKRLERAAQVIQRQTRFNEFVKDYLNRHETTIYDIIAYIEEVEDYAESLEEYFKDFLSQLEILKAQYNVVLERITTEELKNVSQDEKINDLQDTSSLHSNQIETLGDRDVENRGRIDDLENRVSRLEALINGNEQD